MNTFRVSRDKNSGALIVERDFAVEDRIGICVDIYFRPKGLWRRLLLLLGMDYPGPVAMEVVTGGNIVYSDSHRTFRNLMVVESSYVVAKKGNGIVRAVLNPEDFNRKWRVSIGVKELSN